MEPELTQEELEYLTALVAEDNASPEVENAVLKIISSGLDELIEKVDSGEIETVEEEVTNEE